MLTDAPFVTRTHNLPHRLTPLLGREAELAQIKRQLLDPACRLLTLLGPGGMGKTRLAIEVATRLQDEFAAGVCFVNLQPVSDPAQLPTALADALHFPLSGSDPVESQLHRYLANKELLLLFDNFEHLLAGADFLSALLLQSLGVKALITSRALLNLQEEWLFPLAGLAFPPIGFAPEKLEQYAAATLFVDRMRRLRPHFVLAQEAAAVGRICQLVEGIPLALELAANWTKTLTCPEIADEIEHGIHFLNTSLRNTPERHRSMLAVFAQSWQQLNSEEQAVFARLSVFRGGFRRAAAEEVAGASLTLLSSFVDKSLLRWESGRRYQLHELLRQYAQEKLTQHPDLAAQSVAAHSAYYSKFLLELTPAAKGQDQVAATREIAAELDNLRHAWQWALEQTRSDLLAQAVQALNVFFHSQSRFMEGAQLFGDAARHLAESALNKTDQQLLLTVLVYQAWFLLHLRRHDELQRVLAQSRQLQQILAHPPRTHYLDDPALPQALHLYWRGNYEQVGTLGHEALQNSLTFHNPWNRQVAYFLLARAERVRGDFRRSFEFGQQALQIAQELGDNWFLSFCHSDLGNLALARQEYSLAKQHFSASLELRSAADDLEGVARAECGLGVIAFEQQDYEDAHQRMESALAGYKQISGIGGIVDTLNYLGKIAVERHEYTKAAQFFYLALQTIEDTTALRMILPVLLGIGSLLVKTHHTQLGLTLFAVVLHHPASTVAARREGESWLQKANQRIEPRIMDEAGTNLHGFDLGDLIKHLLGALQTLSFSGDNKQQAVSVHNPSPSANSTLIEPLTERELEILHLIAEGYTNLAIADKLILSPGTVKWYSSEIYGKLGVANRTQAVAEARRLGLLAA